MRTGVKVTVGLLVLAHLFFFVLETFLWEVGPDVPKSLGFTGEVPDEAVNIPSLKKDFAEVLHEVAIVAKNQGLSNGFLAASLVGGLLWYSQGKQEGRTVLKFLLMFILIAGLTGYFTVPAPFPGNLGFLIGQFGLALVALVFIWFDGSKSVAVADKT